MQKGIFKVEQLGYTTSIASTQNTRIHDIQLTPNMTFNMERPSPWNQNLDRATSDA